MLLSSMVKRLSKKASNGRSQQSKVQNHTQSKSAKASKKHEEAAPVVHEIKKSMAEVLRPAGRESRILKELPNAIATKAFTIPEFVPAAAAAATPNASWNQESEIDFPNCASISEKKAKSLRKRMPTWLTIPTSTVKSQEKEVVAEPTSACRPGTLYSDVLFSAGSPCCVKVKTVSPRRNTNGAQRKLTKALLRCTIDSASDTETDQERFPTLGELIKSPTLTDVAKPTSTASALTNLPANTYTKQPLLPIPTPQPLSLPAPPRNPPTAAPPDLARPTPPPWSNLSAETAAFSLQTSTPSRSEDDDESMYVVAPPEANSQREEMKDCSDCATYLPQHSEEHQDGPLTLAVRERERFTIDIPEWNFSEPKAGFPKFLGLFDDERYLKAEKMALVGLKLALGNTNRFR